MLQPVMPYEVKCNTYTKGIYSDGLKFTKKVKYGPGKMLLWFANHMCKYKGYSLYRATVYNYSHIMNKTTIVTISSLAHWEVSFINAHFKFSNAFAAYNII